MPAWWNDNIEQQERRSEQLREATASASAGTPAGGIPECASVPKLSINSSRQPLTPPNHIRPTTARTASPRSARKPPTPRFNNKRSDSARDAKSIERLEKPAYTSFSSRTPTQDKRAADLMAAEQRQREMNAQQSREDTARKREKAAFTERMQRQKEAKERDAVRRKASEAASARASRERDEEAREREKTRKAKWEADARANIKRIFEAEEAAAAEQARRMRHRWKPPPPPPPRKPHRKPSDPYAEWRGSSFEEGVEAEEAVEVTGEVEDISEATEEERQLVAARAAKAKERDDAARRILAHSSRTLTDALGLPTKASDTEVARAVRSLLRLLHPDFAINQGLTGARQQRIEAAFKRLNGLR